jgi:choline dehydrogenase-like flavoprotein
MQQPMTAESTTFTLDTMGRFLANTLQEALDSSAQTIGAARRDFDVIVVGGGSFGSIVAERLLLNDATHSRRILVLEAGPFVLPEHAQNLPFMGGVPDMRRPWVADTPESLANGRKALKYPGLIYAVGGRSLSWGGWSPQLLDAEMQDWPTDVVTDLKTRYFKESSDQIGVDETNDFIYGRLHTGLRKQLFDALKAKGTTIGAVAFADVPDHPVIQYSNPADLTDDVLRSWLGLLPSDATPHQDLVDMFKLEAPLAVQSQTLPGLFPINKFSAVPLLIRAARIAATETGGVGAEADARKRLMVVTGCHVLDLVTETQPDNWVRVTGVRVRDRDGAIRVISLAPPRPDGTQGVAVIALGTIESTRLALSTFKDSLGGRAAERMGQNLMAHLRSNLTIRVPVGSLKALPPGPSSALQASALFVKGRTAVDGVDRYFHLQITASGLSSLGNDAEAELFKKLPDIEHVSAMLRADDTHVVLTLRGIGEMSPQNPDSKIQLAQFDSDFDRPAAYVELGDSGGGTTGASGQTQVDRKVWEAMDRFTDEVALFFASGQPFEILGKAGEVTIPVPAGASAADLALYFDHARRRDALGTTHHDAGTLWMGTDPASSVTNAYGRIHDTTNCYVAAPALFPTTGSPNPMLTGVGLARRTADLLQDKVLFRLPVVAVETGYDSLFDGTERSFNRWKIVGPGGQGFVLVNGELISYGTSDFALLWYARDAFDDFTLRLQFRIFDLQRHNSGVFVRFRNPLAPVAPLIRARALADQAPIDGNPAWTAVFSGFEVQIDDTARGDVNKDFYGLRPEPDGLWKNRTGSIYKIPAGDFIFHLNQHDAAWQQYVPGPSLVPGRWFEYEIRAVGDKYTVNLQDLSTGTEQQTTKYENSDKERGIATIAGHPEGYVGIQSYPGHTVAFRNIRIKRGH